jgi:4'-phosphopantetheinyl transferase
VRSVSVAGADVWVFRSLSPEARASAHLLSEDELERVERARRGEARERFAAVRGTLRAILSSYLDVDPLEVPIVYGPQGKPYLESGPAFSVSHSGSLAAIAVLDSGEVGVDVEQRTPRERLPLLASALLAPSEREWYSGIAEEVRVSAFFDLWSAKEACAKLIGRGLAMPFSSIALLSPEEAITGVTVDHPSAPSSPCFVYRLPAVDPRFSGALAASSSVSSASMYAGSSSTSA